MDRTRQPIRGKARHARRFGGGLNRRDRSDQSGRGALPGRRGNDPLRTDPAHQSRHLRHQRAARPDRESASRAVQPDGRERRPDQGLQDSAGGRCGVRGERESGGLHVARANYHAAQGSFRHPDSHPLPQDDRARDCDHGAGSDASRARGRGGADPAVHEGHPGADYVRGAGVERDQPIVGGLGGHRDQQIKIGDFQRGEARGAKRGERDRAADFRFALAVRVDGREDRTRVRRRRQERRRFDRAADQPRGAEDFRSLSEARGFEEGLELLRAGLGGRGFGQRAVVGIHGTAARGDGTARSNRAAGTVRDAGADGGGERVYFRGPASASEAQQGSPGRALRLSRMTRRQLSAVTTRYTQWDGTQRLKLDGVKVMGLEEFIEQLRQEMRQRYRDFNLKNALSEMEQKLEDILNRERAKLESLKGQKPGIEEKQRELSRMPRRLSEAMRKLESHEFEDAQAKADFDALLEEYENIRDLENFRDRNQHMFHGPKSLGYEDALELMREMERMRQLEQDLMSGNFDTISMEDLQQILGQQASKDFQNLKQVMVLLTQSGYMVP